MISISYTRDVGGLVEIALSGSSADRDMLRGFLDESGIWHTQLTGSAVHLFATSKHKTTHRFFAFKVNAEDVPAVEAYCAMASRGGKDLLP